MPNYKRMQGAALTDSCCFSLWDRQQTWYVIYCVEEVRHTACYMCFRVNVKSVSLHRMYNWEALLVLYVRWPASSVLHGSIHHNGFKYVNIVLLFDILELEVGLRPRVYVWGTTNYGICPFSTGNIAQQLKIRSSIAVSIEQTCEKGAKS